MTDQYKKKLIEVALPLEAINAASSREKARKVGKPSSIHHWWARRPFTACRAVLFAQLVDDPSAWPDRFPTEEAQERERQRLFRIIEELVLWENSNNERVLNKARAEIARSLAWARGKEPPSGPKAVNAYIAEHAPPVYDPFCGGGSIPLEAQRLGLKAYGSDLNPVAVMISKALVEIPPKFAGRPPVNPEAQAELKRGGAWNGKGAQGLAEDVRYYGQWMRDEAFKRIGHLYPQVDLPPEHGGGKATVIAWIWARTVECPNPTCRAKMPLITSFFLSTKAGKNAWIEPLIDRNTMSIPEISFRIKTGKPSTDQAKEFKVGSGYIGTSGKRTQAVFRCIACDQGPVKGQYIDEEANAGRVGVMPTAIVAKGPKGRIYVSPSTEQLQATRKASAFLDEHINFESIPNEPCRGTFASNAQGRIYGFRTFANYFTDRQLVALTTFSDLVQEARKLVLADAGSVGLSTDGLRLTDGGTNAEAYADAIAVYLGFILNRVADWNSSLSRWEANVQVPQQTFSRQAISMVWDFSEANPLGESTGSFYASSKNLVRSLLFLKDLKAVSTNCKIFQHDAQSPTLEPIKPLISTDPPYYDNIAYADLSDFFYVWMRRSLKSFFPNLFRTVLVPKAEELVATPFRHDGKENAEMFFLDGMIQAIHRMAEQSNENFPTTIYYAFKQSEVEAEGIASTGWATFLEAIGQSGFAVVGTWPLRTEMKTRQIAMGTNALASSIVLVCRKRPENTPVTTRAEFLNVLKRELPDALKLLQHGNIAPVDMAQASIGPGMAIFTKSSKVLESDDSPMTVKTALQLINQALDEYLSEQEAEYDADTRFAITWFGTHGMETGPYGTAETLATARGVAVAGVVEAGILEARGGNVRLLRRDEMPEEWDPATDKRLCVWECAQHLIRVLENDGESAAADLLGRLGARGEVARDLAYRLYGICERKKWAEEARAYNSLVVAWPELTKLASSAGTGLAQTELAL